VHAGEMARRSGGRWGAVVEVVLAAKGMLATMAAVCEHVLPLFGDGGGDGDDVDDVASGDGCYVRLFFLSFSWALISCATYFAGRREPVFPLTFVRVDGGRLLACARVFVRPECAA